MSESLTPDKANQVWELVKILISVCSGYLLSVVNRIWIDKRNIANIKTIIFKEMSENYKRINPVLPRDKTFHPALIDLPVQFSQALSFDVYEKYLNRLAEFEKEELVKIYDAYYHLTEFAKAARQFPSMTNSTAKKDPPEVELLRIRAFIQHAIYALDKTETALNIFKDGAIVISEEKPRRGAEYERVYNLAQNAVGGVPLRAVPQVHEPAAGAGSSKEKKGHE